jgi:7tm Odorant receptor
MAINWMEPFEKINKLLKISGLWMDQSFPKLLITILVILHIFFVEIFTIFGIFYLINVESIKDFSEAVGTVLLYVTFRIKSLHFLFNKTKIESMLKDIKELIEHENWIEKQNGRKLKQRIRQIHKILRIFMTSAMTGVVAGSLAPFFIHELPLKMWFPYDYINSEALFWLSAAYQDIGGYYVIPVMIVLEIIPIYFISYVTGVIEELSDRMEKIGEEKIVKVKPKVHMSFNEKLIGRSNVSEIFYKNLKFRQAKAAETSQMKKKKPEKDENLEELLKCINIQQKIKSLAKDVADVFGSIIWLQGFISTFILCATAFLLTVVSTKALKLIYLINIFTCSLASRKSRCWAIFFVYSASNSSNPYALLLCQQLVDGF